jgi:glycosyltransferase involved in cell wall biosynthesis
MKILIINQHPQDVVGGSEIQCDLIGTWLSRFGHQVGYFAVKAKSENYKNYEYKVIPQTLHFLKDLKRVLSQEKPQLVYWRYNKKHLLASVLLCKFYGCKVVFSISTYSDTQAWIWGGIHPFENLLNNLKGFTSFTARIRSLKLLWDPLKSFLNYLGFYMVDGVVGIQRRLTHIVPVKDQIAIYNSMDASVQEAFRWPRPYIVWVSNIKSKKNPEAYIELAKHLADEEVDFLMIGKVQQEYYKNLLSKENLPANLHYLGPKSPEEVNSILKSSLMLVHTCNPEGFGNNFIQAWLQGKPSITLYFDPDDLIKDNFLGFHAQSIAQMVADTRKLIREPELRHQIGQQALKFALENFVPKQNALKFEAFFQSVLNS